MPSLEDIAEIRTDMAVINPALEHLNHRMNLLMAVLFLVLGGVLSTLWVLARRQASGAPRRDGQTVASQATSHCLICLPPVL
jgi:hypothetical protein